MDLPGDDFTLNVNRIIVGKANVRESQSYYGDLRNFYFDGRSLFDRFPGDVSVYDTISTTPSLPGGLVPTHPITFPPRYIHFIRISRIQLGADSRIRFLFRTQDGNGVLLYTSRPGGSYLGVELVDGQLVAVADDGSGPRYVNLPTGSRSLADGEWHELDLTRAGPHRFLVRIDGRKIGHLSYRTDPFSNQEQLYIGGVPEHIVNNLPPSMRSRKGLIGCLATLVINEHSYNLQEIAASIPGSHITTGCTHSKHSFTHSFIRLFIHSLIIHSFIHSFIHLFLHSFSEKLIRRQDNTNI